MSGNSDLTDILVHQHAETKLAILVSDDGEEKRAVWLPKSQIEIAPNPATGGSKAIVLVTANRSCLAMPTLAVSNSVTLRTGNSLTPTVTITPTRKGFVKMGQSSPKHGNTPCVRYYVLLVWDKDFVILSGPLASGDNRPTKGRWTPEYGSYSRKDVVDERAYYHESSSNIPIKHMRIKEVCSCEAGQDDLLRLAQQENRP